MSASVAQNPQVLGASLVVANQTALAALDITGMTLGTVVYDAADDLYFQLKVSTASLSAGSVVAVSGITGIRWLVASGGFGADTLLKLPNANAALVNALEMITALTNNGAGTEASALVFKLLAAGAQATALTLDGQGVALPDGSTSAPSLRFASEPGANTGFCYAGPGVIAYSVDAQLMAYFGDLVYGFRLFHRVQETRSADIASGGTITLGNANYAHLTGTTAVNFITTTGWLDGARVELLCPSGVTFNNNTGSPPGNTFALQLLSGANTPIAANGVIAFRKDDALSRWVQVK